MNYTQKVLEARLEVLLEKIGSENDSMLSKTEEAFFDNLSDINQYNPEKYREYVDKYNKVMFNREGGI